jgi:cell division septum initiation protein DivIVA
MTSALKKYGWFVCVLFAVASVGCETTDYEPLVMKKKIKDQEAEIESLKAEIAEMKSSGGSTAVPGSTGRAEVAADNSNSQPEIAAAPTLSAEEEKQIRDELENSDAFFVVNEAGFATEADLAECRIGNAAVAKLADFSVLTKLVLDGVNTNAETYDELAKLTNLEHLEIGRSTPDAAAFEKLKGLKRLKFLQLQKATLSEGAFKVLAEFPALEQIRCGQTRVGDA